MSNKAPPPQMNYSPLHSYHILDWLEHPQTIILFYFKPKSIYFEVAFASTLIHSYNLLQLP